VTPPPSETLDDLPPADLRRVVAVALAELERVGSELGRMQAEAADLQIALAVKDAKIQEQADEIARLKGLPPRPKFKGKPSGMEAATSKPLGRKQKGSQPGRGSKRDKLAVTAEVKLKAVGVPPGSRFKGYEDVTVQDLRIQVGVIRYRRGRWETPDGERLVAEMPAGLWGALGRPDRPRPFCDVVRSSAALEKFNK